MFVKYNDILRGFGPALAGCKGNSYRTTIHVVNSCIVKTSKITRAEKVRTMHAHAHVARACACSTCMRM